jgi:hypothetical protein
MFVDAFQLLSDAQAVTADAVSTNTIDNGAVTPARDIGTGEPLEVVIQVDVAADFTTMDETYAFEVIQSAAANLGSPTVLARRAIAASLLTAGSIHRIPVPPGSITQRYLGVNYDVGGTTPSITVTAFLQPQSMASVAKPISYAKGYTVS